MNYKHILEELRPIFFCNKIRCVLWVTVLPRKPCWNLGACKSSGHSIDWSVMASPTSLYASCVLRNLKLCNISLLAAWSCELHGMKFSLGHVFLYSRLMAHRASSLGGLPSLLPAPTVSGNGWAPSSPFLANLEAQDCLHLRRWDPLHPQDHQDGQRGGVSLG